MNHSRTLSTDSSGSSITAITSLDTTKLIVGSKIAHSTFPVFNAEIPGADHDYVLKVFPYTKKRLNEGYKNEVRFCSLMHPNIAKVTKTDDDFYIQSKGKNVHVSLIIIEKAIHGELTQYIKTLKEINDDALVRSFFSHIIKAMEYLHFRYIAHLDIMTDNLVFDENFCIRMIDFDSSYMEGDKKLKGSGSTHFRAPELIEDRNPNPFKCDIYSAGIVLFAMKVGHLPFDENKPTSGIDLKKLLETDTEQFWKVHEAFSDNTFTKEFKELFEAMTAYDPEKRPTLKEIKEFKWYQDRKYPDFKLRDVMYSHLRPSAISPQKQKEMGRNNLFKMTQKAMINKENYNIAAK